MIVSLQSDARKEDGTISAQDKKDRIEKRKLEKEEKEKRNEANVKDLAGNKDDQLSWKANDDSTSSISIPISKESFMKGDLIETNNLVHQMKNHN